MTSEGAAGALPPAPEPRAQPQPLLIPALVDVALLIFVLVVFSVLLVAAVLVPGTIALGPDATHASAQHLIEQSMPAVIAAAITAVLLTALVIWHLRRKTLQPMPAPMAPRAAYGFAVLAGIVIQAGALAMLSLLSSLGAQAQTSNAQPLMEIAETAPWLTALLVVIAAPLAEELLFRHMLLRRYVLAGRAWLGLVLTSVLFSLMHEPFPDGSPVLEWLAGLGLYVGMGIAFGLVYLRTGRLGAAFLAHAVCNLCAMALLAYSTS